MTALIVGYIGCALVFWVVFTREVYRLPPQRKGDLNNSVFCGLVGALFWPVVCLFFAVYYTYHKGFTIIGELFTRGM